MISSRASGANANTDCRFIPSGAGSDDPCPMELVPSTGFTSTDRSGIGSLLETPNFGEGSPSRSILPLTSNGQADICTRMLGTM